MSKEAYRMQVVTRARSFKRSWVDMAEALVNVRSRDLYREWGFETLHGYALEELNIKRSTVDKLTGSFSAMERHAPHVLEWDGVAQELPTMDAVDYFAKAVHPKPKREGDPVPEPPAEEVVADLKTAIFEDLAGAPALRRRFNDVLRPKSEDDQRRELLGRVRSTADRLESLVTHVEQLDEDRVGEVSRCMEQLRADLDRLAAENP
ncbi:MAG: hypothetical protein H6719_22480 [Sandaracinaceae bacterium]|nr:hypothetical protein [Sandaracinaceae bacterium]